MAILTVKDLRKALRGLPPETLVVTGAAARTEAERRAPQYVSDAEEVVLGESHGEGIRTIFEATYLPREMRRAVCIRGRAA